MILDLSDEKFKHIMDDKELFLPIRWKGYDFALVMDQHFKHYLKSIETNVDMDNKDICLCSDYREISDVCNTIVLAVEKYLNGFPSHAYEIFCKAMRLLIKKPLKVYQKNIFELFGDDGHYTDNLDLYRVVRVYENKPYPRSRVFHTPYNMRSKVSSSRYSIAGYPSLYLTTALALGCEELHIDPYQDLVIGSRFQLDRNLESTETIIRVIELSVKPQDFIFGERENRINTDASNNRRISHELLNNRNVRDAYLLWYPLISACSFIRTNKSDPFAAEYIIPQLVMQWVRSEMQSSDNKDYHQLTGIRYFSCSSQKASDMGFNYVFPTSGLQFSDELPYCRVLSKAFRLTMPVFLNEFPRGHLHGCEHFIKWHGDLDYIYKN